MIGGLHVQEEAVRLGLILDLGFNGLYHLLEQGLRGAKWDNQQHALAGGAAGLAIHFQNKVGGCLPPAPQLLSVT